MHKIQEVRDKVNSLFAYAKAQGRDEDKLNALFAPLFLAITQFYGIDFKEPIETCIVGLVHASIRSGMVYEDYDPPKASDAPVGYDDVTNLFRFMDNLINTSNEELNASIVETTDETDVDEIYCSDVVNELTIEWQSAGTLTLNNLNKIADYANGYAVGDTVRLLINPPKLLGVPKISDIAENIFQARGYAEAIEALNIDVYIPML